MHSKAIIDVVTSTTLSALLLPPTQILSSGQCGCTGYDLTQGDDYEEIYDRLTMADDIIGDAEADVKREVVSIICSTTANDGDHLQVRKVLCVCRFVRGDVSVFLFFLWPQCPISLLGGGRVCQCTIDETCRSCTLRVRSPLLKTIQLL